MKNTFLLVPVVQFSILLALVLTAYYSQTPF
jgi:hypothetical protein